MRRRSFSRRRGRRSYGKKRTYTIARGGIRL